MAARHNVMSLKRKIFSLDDFALQNLIKLVGKKDKCKNADEILYYLEKTIDSLLSEEAERRESLKLILNVCLQNVK
ncbi:hypothetical protein DPMN_070473 [Dreissena polymorpha]|uniref:Uncharacterized protein n=1 Tax=Dreissena polymorpha TaxID=45954 RepID=A0A9D4BV50_DREPO|nr:hypothetical protein DPMN_070473 [Dreissena polymorpha]